MVHFLSICLRHRYGIPNNLKASSTPVPQSACVRSATMLSNNSAVKHSIWRFTDRYDELRKDGLKEILPLSESGLDRDEVKYSAENLVRDFILFCFISFLLFEHVNHMFTFISHVLNNNTAPYLRGVRCPRRIPTRITTTHTKNARHYPSQSLLTTVSFHKVLNNTRF